MSIREKIIDKYWSEFLLSNHFNVTVDYRNSVLELAFWDWFKDTYLTNEKPKNLEDYILEEI